MIRVGIIANTFEQTFGGLAGGHIHFLEVAKRWDDFELVVFAPEIARGTIAAELPHACFVSMPSLSVSGWQPQMTTLYRSVFAPLRIRQLRCCDVLLATSQFLPDLVPALFARNRRLLVTIPHILDPPSVRTGSKLANTISFVFQALALFLVRKFAAAVLVNTPETASKMGLDTRKTAAYTMTHGVDHVIGISTEVREKDALYLGRLVPTKGVDELIEAWTVVVSRIPTAMLTIAGGGDQDYVASLKELARRLHVSQNVDFRGRVSDEDRITLLQEHRIFVFPSKEEGWGIAIAEAMANGLPCVTYDLEAYRNVFVRGRFSVPVSDVREFSGAIIRLLNDSELRESAAADALSLGRTFSWARAATIERLAIQDIFGQARAPREQSATSP